MSAGQSVLEPPSAAQPSGLTLVCIIGAADLSAPDDRDAVMAQLERASQQNADPRLLPIQWRESGGDIVVEADAAGSALSDLLQSAPDAGQFADWAAFFQRLARSLDALAADGQDNISLRPERIRIEGVQRRTAVNAWQPAWSPRFVLLREHAAVPALRARLDVADIAWLDKPLSARFAAFIARVLHPNNTAWSVVGRPKGNHWRGGLLRLVPAQDNVLAAAMDGSRTFEDCASLVAELVVVQSRGVPADDSTQARSRTLPEAVQSPVVRSRCTPFIIWLLAGAAVIAGAVAMIMRNGDDQKPDGPIVRPREKAKPQAGETAQSLLASVDAAEIVTLRDVIDKVEGLLEIPVDGATAKQKAVPTDLMTLARSIEPRSPELAADAAVRARRAAPADRALAVEVMEFILQLRETSRLPSDSPSAQEIAARLPDLAGPLPDTEATPLLLRAAACLAPADAFLQAAADRKSGIAMDQLVRRLFVSGRDVTIDEALRVIETAEILRDGNSVTSPDADRANQLLIDAGKASAWKALDEKAVSLLEPPFDAESYQWPTPDKDDRKTAEQHLEAALLLHSPRAPWQLSRLSSTDRNRRQDLEKKAFNDGDPRAIWQRAEAQSSAEWRGWLVALAADRDELEKRSKKFGADAVTWGVGKALDEEARLISRTNPDLAKQYWEFGAVSLGNADCMASFASTLGDDATISEDLLRQKQEWYRRAASLGQPGGIRQVTGSGERARLARDTLIARDSQL